MLLLPAEFGPTRSVSGANSSVAFRIDLKFSIDQERIVGGRPDLDMCFLMRWLVLGLGARHFDRSLDLSMDSVLASPLSILRLCTRAV